MDDNRLVKVPKKWETKHFQATWTVSKTLVRKSDMNVTEEQTPWIKYWTWPYKKKKKKKKKTLVKPEDLKMHRSAG